MNLRNKNLEFEKIAIIGGTGTGKTSYFREFIEPTIRQKMLVVDMQDHPLWQDLPKIKIPWLQQWTSGKKRIVLHEDGDELLEMLMRKVPGTSDKYFVENTSILFEDASNYLGDRVVDPRIKTLCRMSKQRHLRLYFMFHAWIYTYTDLFRFLDGLVLFNCKDSIDCRKDYLAADFATSKATDLRVKQKYRETNAAFINAHSHCTYNEIIDLS